MKALIKFIFKVGIFEKRMDILYRIGFIKYQSTNWKQKSIDTGNLMYYTVKVACE